MNKSFNKMYNSLDFKEELIHEKRNFKTDFKIT